MRSRSWRRTASVLAIALLAAFSVALAEDAFFHTDDGCAVERHCLACRWHHGAAASPTSITAPVAVLAPGDLVGNSSPVALLEVALPKHRRAHPPSPDSPARVSAGARPLPEAPDGGFSKWR
jgi:hypothetical protein